MERRCNTSTKQNKKKNNPDGPHNETFSKVQQGRKTHVTPRSGARSSGPLTQQTESHLHTICIRCKFNKKLEDNEKTAGVLVSFASIMEISKQEKEEKHLKRSGVGIHRCNSFLIFPPEGQLTAFSQRKAAVFYQR